MNDRNDIDAAQSAWLAANQQALAAAFRRLSVRLQSSLALARSQAGGAGSGRDADSGDLRGSAAEDAVEIADGADGGSAVAGAQAASAIAAAAIEPPAFERIVQVFGLSGFERDVLLLAAAVEMDPALATLVAAVQQSRHRTLSFGLALGLLEGAHWSALSPQAPLRRWRLIEVDGSLPLTQAALRIDERILHAMAGLGEPDARLRPLLEPLSAPELQAPSHARMAGALAGQLGRLREASPCVILHGEDADGQADLAAVVAGFLGLAAFRLDAADIPALPTEQDALATLWQREAALGGAALFIDARPALHRGSAVDPGVLARWIAQVRGGLVFLGADQPIPGIDGLPVRVDKPAPDEQRALWQQVLDPMAADATLPAVAATYRLSARTIAQRAHALPDAGSLQQRCRMLSRPRLEGLARRVEATARWEDLVLPDAQMKTLRLIAGQLRHRITVHGDWGFGAAGQRGLGLSALFFGDSGTGKTLACEVLANEIDLDLYRIDLSAVVSKYIGETEKNLGRVFDAAEDCGAILLFDEADALFGKRSEVKDSHDRYANIEVSYLLQRMETYGGLVVLTTNQRSALDPAFLRRLRFVVQFPFPDAEQRERIWARVFPPSMPRGELDVARLARLPMAGGNIRNIALNAAFFAADEAAPVRMAHLAQAAHLEATKQERPLAESQTRGWE